MEERRLARIQESSEEVSPRLAAMEMEKATEETHAMAIQSTAGKASEEAANTQVGLRKAAQALGNLGTAVQVQQNASEQFHERLHGVEETHAWRTETVEGELAGIKRAIEELNHKVAEATSSLVCRPATPLSTVGDKSPSPKGPVAWAATSGVDAARPVGPVLKKVMHFEGLRTPGVTESCYAPKGTPFGKLPLDAGAVGWHEESVNWSSI